MTTRVRPDTFAVPQVRDRSLHLSFLAALEKGVRSECALTLALAEMDVQGVSTRKVAAIPERLCGVELSSMQVSRAALQLDAQREQWRTRPLGPTPYLARDARDEKVQIDGQVCDAAVLLARGVLPTGTRVLLGMSVAVSEQEVHWRPFLPSLVVRGLSGRERVTSDAYLGVKAARRAVLGGVPSQRGQFHLQQNAHAFVPRQDMKTEVAAPITNALSHVVFPNRSSSSINVRSSVLYGRERYV